MLFRAHSHLAVGLLSLNLVSEPSLFSVILFFRFIVFGCCPPLEMSEDMSKGLLKESDKAVKPPAVSHACDTEI